MTHEQTLNHQFVEFIPEELAERTVYISIRFATVSHLCICGCRNKVVTPLSPTDWQLIFDGKSISIYPSIGNWSFPCRSHYWIKNNKTSWAEDWSTERIEAGRAANNLKKERYYKSPTQENDSQIKPKKPEKSGWRRWFPW